MRHSVPEAVIFGNRLGKVRNGQRKLPAPFLRLAKLEAIFSRHASVPFDDESAAIAGRRRKELENQGRVIGPHDLQIAAIALQHEWTLVTNNKDEFSRVEGLKIEDWTV